MKDLRLLVATQNRGKLQELRNLLKPLPVELWDLTSFPDVGLVAETGNTFVENASLKASGYATKCGLTTLADDSGLEVEALGGAPGIYSARYAGANASDSERVEKLLSELSEVQERAARFVSVVAIADPSGTILDISRGVCKGTIVDHPRGVNGFGYDPIFVPEGFNLTFAELPADVKNQISHRAQAFHRTANFLRSLTLRRDAG